MLVWAWWKALLRMTTGASAWSLPIPEAKPAARPRVRLSDRVAAIGFGWLPAPARAVVEKLDGPLWEVVAEAVIEGVECVRPELMRRLAVAQGQTPRA